jgi:hypothetical protein
VVCLHSLITSTFFAPPSWYRVTNDVIDLFQWNLCLIGIVKLLRKWSGLLGEAVGTNSVVPTVSQSSTRMSLVPVDIVPMDSSSELWTPEILIGDLEHENVGTVSSVSS